MIASAASTTVEKYGAHSSTRPISSSTMPSSTNVNPWPPYSSGMWRLCSPSSCAICAPHRGVVALGGLHEAAHLGRRRLRLQEAAHGVAQLVLLFGEGEVHGSGSCAWSGRSRLDVPRTLPDGADDPASTGRAGTRRDGAGDTLDRMARPAHYETPTSASTSSSSARARTTCSCVRCKGTGEAVIIDAANEHELLLEVSRATGVRRVLTTHGHWDHIQAVEAVRDAGIDVGHRRPRTPSMLPAYDFVIPDDERDRSRRPAAAHHPQPGPHAGLDVVPARGAPDRCSAATPCSPAAPATPRCPAATSTQIIESIDRKLFTLPADTLVLPGHGLDTTIGTERPHLQEWVDRGW